MRSTTRRDKHRRHISRNHPPCAHCGQPINYQAHHLDPLSFQIDHVTPLARGGDDTLDNLLQALAGQNPNASTLGEMDTNKAAA